MQEAPRWTRNFLPVAKETQAASVSQDSGGQASPRPAMGLATFWAVPADPFSDQSLPLPEGGPHKVVGPTADLDHLPRGIHERPGGAFWVGVADILSIPHLGGEKEASSLSFTGGPDTHTFTG